MSRRKRNEWSRTWINQTELGTRFGMSAVAVGKVLTGLGLKDGSLATEKAVTDGLATMQQMKAGPVSVRWHGQRVTELIEAAGHARVGRKQAEAAQLSARAARIARDIHRMDEGDGSEQKMARFAYDMLDEEYGVKLADMVRAELERLG